MGAEEQITEALMPAVQTAGLEIWDVERSGATLRVLVERPGGVDARRRSPSTAACERPVGGDDVAVAVDGHAQRG